VQDGKTWGFGPRNPGEAWFTPVAIFAIVLLDAALGFTQEYRAERAMAALRKFSSPKVRVRREGARVEIPSSELVPGDLVLLEAGNLVPADGRVIESASLRIQEAVLTGESEAVEKRSTAILEDGSPALGDQINMAFMGTSVAYGRGQVLVTATGGATELGRVASLLQSVGPVATPLQRRLNRLGRVLAAAALAVVGAIFGLGLLLGEDRRLMFMTSVSMAVAVIPEGMPAVVTIALAFGTQRMLRRRALIRRLPAVETLGSVTVICSDKTGTLTENWMTVTVLDLAGHRLEVPEAIRRRMLEARLILWQGLLLGALNLAVTFWAWSTRQTAWQTVAMNHGGRVADFPGTSGSLVERVGVPSPSHVQSSPPLRDRAPPPPGRRRLLPAAALVVLFAVEGAKRVRRRPAPAGSVQRAG
jgi:magnesium-transporting ATPase (P-type)